MYPYRSELHLAWMISYIFVMMPTSVLSSSPWKSASCRHWTLTSIFQFHTASSVATPRWETTYAYTLKRQVELLWSQLTHTGINVKCMCVFVKVRKKERPCRVACFECLCVCKVRPVCFLRIPWGICVCMTSCHWLLPLAAVRSILIFNSWINWALVKDLQYVFVYVFICWQNCWFY